MARAMLKLAAATALFAIAHSALASAAAKEAAARLLGEDRRNALYRPFFLLQSVATLAALAAYGRRLPAFTLYQVRGPVAALMRGGQAAALLYAAWAAHQVGIRRMLGLSELARWAEGGKAAPEPEAQGPALGADGWMRASGPFAWSRHPLNLAFLPVFWLFPRMTTRMATFGAVSTLYLVLGSVHEEVRLEAAYGDAYRAYQRSGVPFYLPRAGGLHGSAARPPLPERHAPLA